MSEPLKRDDEPTPRPRVGGPDAERVPGSEDRVEEVTETNIEIAPSEADQQVLPTPIEQQQDIETMDSAGGTIMSPTLSPEDKADDIINGGIARM